LLQEQLSDAIVTEHGGTIAGKLTTLGKGSPAGEWDPHHRGIRLPCWSSVRHRRSLLPPPLLARTNLHPQLPACRKRGLTSILLNQSSYIL
jgi:hypothetical protein